MGSLVVAAVVAASGGGAVTDGAVVPAGFWPGGGQIWSGTTYNYNYFGREAPPGYGFAVPEAFGLYQDLGRNTDVYGPGGYRRPNTGWGSDRSGRTRTGGWVGGGVGFGRWRR